MNDKVAIEPDDIIFTAKTANYCKIVMLSRLAALSVANPKSIMIAGNQYLTNLRGIVTMEGSATAHPMLIGRERDLPVICGVPGLINTMQRFDGCTVTMDGLTKKIYVSTQFTTTVCPSPLATRLSDADSCCQQLGEQKLRAAKQEEISIMFEPQKIPSQQTYESGLEFLLAWDRAVTRDGVHWAFNPNWPMCKAWREMIAVGYPRRIEIVNACRKSCGPLPADTLDNVTRTIDGKSADRCTEQDFYRFQQIFDDFDIDDGEAFHRACLEVVHQYTTASRSFGKQQSLATWRAFADAYMNLMAIMNLHYYWQMFLKKRSATSARRLGMSQLHFEQFLVRLQEETEEEDVRYRRLIIEAAALLEQSGHARDGEPDPRRLLDKVDGLRSAVTTMARSFRTKASTDITDDLDNAIDVVLSKVMDAFEQRNTSTSTFDHDQERVQIDFYPENDQEENLTRWTRLSVASRCQKSDFHHFRLAGQWLVRDALEEIFGDLGLELKAVLAEASVADIEGHIERCQAQRHAKVSAAAEKFFPVPQPDPSLVDLAASLNARLQDANDGSGRQLARDDADLVYPLMRGLAAALPAWLSNQGDDWPLRVGGIAGVKRIDVMSTPSFDVRLHRFGVGYADATPHTHNWNFFSLCLDGSYEHQLYRRANDDVAELISTEEGQPTNLFDRWPRPGKGAYGQEPSEIGVQLELQLGQMHRQGGGYFIHSKAIHGIASVEKEVVTMIMRSKLQSVGFSDTYARERPVWSNTGKAWSPEDTVAAQTKEWARRLREIHAPVAAINEDAGAQPGDGLVADSLRGSESQRGAATGAQACVGSLAVAVIAALLVRTARA